jgi:hypothetical protein
VAVAAVFIVVFALFFAYFYWSRIAVIAEV